MLNISSVRIEGSTVPFTASTTGLENLQQRCRIVGYSAIGAAHNGSLIELTETTGGEVRLEFDVSGQTHGRGVTNQLDISGGGILFHTGVKIRQSIYNGNEPTTDNNKIGGITLFYQT